MSSHRIEVAGLTRDLPLVRVADGLRIALFNMLGDAPLVEACADALAPHVPGEAQALVTAEAKSIPLAHAVAHRVGLPYVVLRKSWKPYMGKTVQATTHSITTGAAQTLHLDEREAVRIRGAAVALIDDVVSTGSTLAGMRAVLAKVGARDLATLAVFTEGDPDAFPHVARLGHLPLFRDA